MRCSSAQCRSGSSRSRRPRAARFLLHDARGRPDFPPLELVRFFGTNYYYRQPEIDANTVFALNSDALLDEFERAKARGIELRPVIMGPVSLLLLSKVGPATEKSDPNFTPLDLLDALLPEYEKLFEQLAKPVRPVFSWTSLRSPRTAPPRS